MSDDFFKESDCRRRLGEIVLAVADREEMGRRFNFCGSIGTTCGSYRRWMALLSKSYRNGALASI